MSTSHVSARAVHAERVPSEGRWSRRALRVTWRGGRVREMASDLEPLEISRVATPRLVFVVAGNVCGKDADFPRVVA